MTTTERITFLSSQRAVLAPWIGTFDRELLETWLEAELGDRRALEQWVPCRTGSGHSKAVPLQPLLQVVSGNSPHATFQTVVRGFLIGCHQWVKLPRSGQPEFEAWHAGLPAEVAASMELAHVLPEQWHRPAATIVFGGAEAISAIRQLLSAPIPLIPHGPKIGLAIVLEPSDCDVNALAQDILRFDQRGCLSVQSIWVAGSETEIHGFCEALAAALETTRSTLPASSPALSESGACLTARDLIRFRQANGEALRIWHSPHSSGWTVVYDRETALASGPLGGFVRVHPLPDDIASANIDPDFLSTVCLHPFTPEAIATLDALGPPRICRIGSAQDPAIDWHADGHAPLASLVRWRDLD